MPLRVNSPAFSNGSAIPRKYTCDGENTAPPLEWRDVPSDAKSVVVICEDPDAPSGAFAHWVHYNIPVSEHGLPDHQTIGTSGVNSFGNTGFGGPCPPKKDNAHHYHFRVYALDVDSIGEAGLSQEDALKAMRGHVLAEADLVGTYKRAG